MTDSGPLNCNGPTKPALLHIEYRNFWGRRIRRQIEQWYTLVMAERVGHVRPVEKVLCRWSISTSVALVASRKLGQG